MLGRRANPKQGAFFRRRRQGRENSCRVTCATSETPIMDFIPLPDGVTSHEPVPDLGGPDFDNKGYRGYDERQGWNLGPLRKGDLEDARSDWDDSPHKRFKTAHSGDFQKTRETVTMQEMQERAGSFIQTWILYGIFQEALNRPVLRDEASILTDLDPREKAGLVGCTTDLDPQEKAGLVERSKRQSDSLSEGSSGKGKADQTRCITVRLLFQDFLEKLKNSQTSSCRDPENDSIHIDSEDECWATRLLGCVSDASSLLTDLYVNSRALERSSIMPPVVYQALLLLITSIFDRVRKFLPSETLSSLTCHYVPCHKELIAKLEGRGWCCSLIERVGSVIGIEGLYYASLFPEFWTEPHYLCRRLVCTASSIDRDKYRGQHVPEYCRCTQLNCDHDPKQLTCLCWRISMPEIELREAFAREGFPLVRFQNYQITVVRFTQGVSYVALSHVWADGRGNPSSNAMPICQLQMFNRCVGELYPDSDRLFWIDTLCVPIHEPLRKRAILQMATVYSKATCVLVLSAELMSINIPSTHDEAIFRIFCSSWNTRLWTMQEAILARELAFQFKDRTVRYRQKLAQTLPLVMSATDKSPMILWEMSCFLLESFEVPTFCGRPSIARLCRALRSRSTSKLSDVAICGSVLLKSDLGHVLDTPDDQKMETFWKCQKKVPVGILWCNFDDSHPCSRFKQDGLRWAPRSLLQLGELDDRPEAEITATGLPINGVKAIHMENFSLPDEMAAETYDFGAAETYDFEFGIPGLPQRYFSQISGDDKHAFPDVIKKARQLVLLLMQLPDRQDLEPGALIMPFGDITNVTGTLIHARYLFSAYTVQKDACSYFTEIKKTRVIPSTQRWHIM